MMDRIVVPTAAVVGTLATATAVATIGLLLTSPTAQVVVPPGGAGLLPYLYAVATTLVEAVWAVLRYL
jgi:hypothetical protein